MVQAIPVVERAVHQIQIVCSQARITSIVEVIIFAINVLPVEIVPVVQLAKIISVRHNVLLLANAPGISQFVVTLHAMHARWCLNVVAIRVVTMLLIATIANAANAEQIQIVNRQ